MILGGKQLCCHPRLFLKAVPEVYVYDAGSESFTKLTKLPFNSLITDVQYNNFGKLACFIETNKSVQMYNLNIHYPAYDRIVLGVNREKRANKAYTDKIVAFSPSHSLNRSSKRFPELSWYKCKAKQVYELIELEDLSIRRKRDTEEFLNSLLDETFEDQNKESVRQHSH